MEIRKLKYDDIPYMLEWMKEKDINQYFQNDFSKMTTDDAKKFIDKSLVDDTSKHFAVTNDNDEYMGTVSLKNIDSSNDNCEYAISLRTCAQGQGFSIFATDEILKYAFEKLNMNRVYLCVLSENIRANKFYIKYGFEYEGEFLSHIKIHGEYKDLKWYAILKKDYKARNQNV